ncbi:exonuclease domain-containing protein [Corynebacterium mayonis]|uniref:exonuclease domain-containing protein n=1 Tax=Corynebacterium mayonis TaxID=3062461 RepID=UPI0031407A5A
MISAHGATISVSNTALVIQHSPLGEALSGREGEDIAIDAITNVEVLRSANAWDTGEVKVDTADGPLVIRFYPGDTEGAERFVELISAARRGEAPDLEEPQSLAGIPGFNFVGFDVETANQAWGSICQIGLVKFIDGVEVERASWLCTPPESLAEFDPYNVGIHGIDAAAVEGQPSVAERIVEMQQFVGSFPVVAHNAQFDASALRDACLATGVDVPPIMFACTLAQTRAVSLDVRDHKLPTLAEHFGVELDKHHDACADAAACAGIMVAVARQAGHRGDVMSFVHSTGYAMGSIGADRLTPVLRDRSGAARALQAQAALSSDPATVVAAAATPRGSNQAGPEVSSPSSAKRSAAAWHSVATPETVPEPNPQADPSAALYGHNVTLTGEFVPYDKAMLWNAIADQGATVGKNVTKKTTVLVAGEWATMTTKEKRARELKDKGQDIEIWTSQQLFDALGLAPAEDGESFSPHDEQPPF